MARKKVSTVVYVDPGDLEALKALSAATRVPWAVFVREGLATVLARELPELHPRSTEVPRG